MIPLSVQLACNVISSSSSQLKLTLDNNNDWCMKGVAYHQQGKLDLAEMCYRRVTPCMPGYLSALNNLGMLLSSLNQFDEAEKLCKMAIMIKPDYVDASVNLGNILFCKFRLDEAEQVCRQALSINPNVVELYGILGNVLGAKGCIDEAENNYKIALTLRPESLELLICFGNLLTQLGRMNEAEEVYRKALTIQPDYMPAINNLGNILIFFGRIEESETLLSGALSYRPNDVQVLLNLGVIKNILGRRVEAEAYYRKALEYKPDYISALSNLLFMHNFCDYDSLDKPLADARRYGKLVSAQVKPFHHCSNPSESSRRLIVGLVSGDLLKHPVGYVLNGILPLFDLQKVEIYVYSTFIREDELTKRMQSVIPHWRMVTDLTDEALAQQIRADRVDILMDLSGHTNHNRLAMFAWKAAPVQVTWLGYFATTGLEAMDYILGDPYNLPVDEADHFVETPWRLPESYICYTPPDVELEISPLPALKNGFITFGCCNGMQKITENVVACWARILQSVPTSRLFLKNKMLIDSVMCHRVFERFKQYGIHKERLILEGPSSWDEYFNAYHKIDIALDPFPYPGVTTSIDGLWMGVPFITKKGRRYLSHQGESILSNAGLADWIANDIEDYVAKAVLFSQDMLGLMRLRAGLRMKIIKSPLLNTQAFADNMIRAWQEMWCIWCESGHAQP
ncbi:MAG: tetratricopeptide repeat protein [Magnetococcales bacterium]|nr:tetratricopeptide repeat protein [Magnetococcales bacterium]